MSDSNLRQAVIDRLRSFPEEVDDAAAGDLSPHCKWILEQQCNALIQSVGEICDRTSPSDA